MKFYDADSRRKEGFGARKLRADGKPDRRCPAPKDYVSARFPLNGQVRLTEDIKGKLREMCFYLRMSRNEILSAAVERYYYSDIDKAEAATPSSDDGLYPIKSGFRYSLRTKDQMRALSYHLKKSRNEVVKDAMEGYYKDMQDRLTDKLKDKLTGKEG